MSLEITDVASNCHSRESYGGSEVREQRPVEMNWSSCCCGSGMQKEQVALAIAAEAASAPVGHSVENKEHLVLTVG